MSTPVDLTSATQAVLTDGMNELRLDLIDNQRAKGLRDQGGSANSLNVTVASTENTIAGQLRGFGRWRFQEHGHGPTRSGKPSRRMVEEIRGWVDRHGIDPKAAYPIAAKIARVGTKVPNSHNPGGVLSEVLNTDNVRKKLAPRLRTAIFKELRSHLFNR